MKTLDKVLAKLENTKGRKMAAHDVRVMKTTQDLKAWVNANRRISMASKRADSEQIG